MRRIIRLGAVGIAMLVLCAIPALGFDLSIHYQGVIMDEGEVIEDGDWNMEFLIYSAPTEGDLLWSEAQTVATENGVFSATLGLTEPLDASAFSGEAWLEVAVEGTAFPRQRIAAVAYAFAAASAEALSFLITESMIDDGAVTGDKVAADALGADQIADIYVFNTGDTISGDLAVTGDLSVAGDLDVAGYANHQFLTVNTGLIAVSADIESLSTHSLVTDMLSTYSMVSDSADFGDLHVDHSAVIDTLLVDHDALIGNLEVTGTTTGVNADTLDLLDSTQFMRTDADTSTTGDLSVAGNLEVADWASFEYLLVNQGMVSVSADIDTLHTHSLDTDMLSTSSMASNSADIGDLHVGNTAAIDYLYVDHDAFIGNLEVTGTTTGVNADTLDLLDSTQFMRTDADTSTTGYLIVGGDLDVAGIASVDYLTVQNGMLADFADFNNLYTYSLETTTLVTSGLVSDSADITNLHVGNTALVHYLSVNHDAVVENLEVTGTFSPAYAPDAARLKKIAMLKWYDVYAEAAYTVGLYPQFIAFDGANMWCSNYGEDSVTKLRATDGEVLGTYFVGHLPFGIALGVADLWVANYDDNTVTRLRACDGAVLGTYPVGTGPWGVAFDGASIWVTNSGEGTVTKLRALDGALVGTYSVGSLPLGIACDGSNLWVANHIDCTVTKLRASDGMQLGTYPVGMLPQGIAFDGSSIWVTNSGEGTVTKLRASDGSFVGTYPVGHQPAGIAFNGAEMWVANSGNDTVTRLRAADGAVLGTYSVGDEPQGVAFDGVGMWVVNSADDSLSKL